jgi:hypothetical protein
MLALTRMSALEDPQPEAASPLLMRWTALPRLAAIVAGPELEEGRDGQRYDDWSGYREVSFSSARRGFCGRSGLRRKLTRGRVLGFFESLPRCLVGIEACSSSHYWARDLIARGHDVRLLPAQYVKPYLKRQKKNDAADAEAICEAVTRPTMRSVISILMRFPTQCGRPTFGEHLETRHVDRKLPLRRRPTRPTPPSSASCTAIARPAAKPTARPSRRSQ